MTAARRAPTTARSSATGTCTAPRHRARCWNSGRSPAPPPRSRPRDHDRKTAEAARYKLGRLTADDADGYHRVQCPAAMGKIRCPLRPSSMTLDRDRPEILTPPEHPQACCTQQTITVPPDVLAKTAQKHDYPSAAWRRSYARRTGAERGFATVKDPAASDISPRLVPPHGPGPADAVRHHAAGRPQPAHPAPPGTPGRKKTSAAPPRACPRKPANAAARPSPASPPDRPDRRRHDHEPAPVTTTTAATARRKHALSTGQTRDQAPSRRPKTPAPRPWATKRPECQTQT